MCVCVCVLKIHMDEDGRCRREFGRGRRRLLPSWIPGSRHGNELVVFGARASSQIIIGHILNIYMYGN